MYEVNTTIFYILPTLKTFKLFRMKKTFHDRNARESSCRKHIDSTERPYESKL